MKLVNLVQEKNKREIKAVVYIDDKNNVCTVYDKADCKKVKAKYGDDAVTVYQPGAEEQTVIYALIQENLNVNPNEMSAEISADNALKIMSLLTDIELGDENDKEAYLSLKENPPLILIQVNREVDAIVNTIFRIMYQHMLEIAKYPEELLNASFFINENKELLKEKNTKTKAKTKTKPKRVN